MLSFPNAKINIGLFVTGKRTDGFHNLESVFYPLNCYDLLEFVEDKDAENKNKVKLSVSGHEISGFAEDNLCLKAYRILDSEYKLPPVHIHLHKNIPLGAGLGGGSSNGAHMLMSLNTHFKLGISDKKLLDIANMLGSDCPFFINNTMTLVSGKGDVFNEIKNYISGFYAVIIQPEIYISTPEAYQNVKFSEPEIPLEEILRLPLRKWDSYLVNSFEPYAFNKYPAIKNIKDNLYEAGAMYASMTGSGSAVYGIFDFQIDVSDIIKERIVWEGYL